MTSQGTLQGCVYCIEKRQGRKSFKKCSFRGHTCPKCTVVSSDLVVFRAHRSETCDGRCTTCESLGIPCVRGTKRRGTDEPCVCCQEKGQGKSCSFYVSTTKTCYKCLCTFNDPAKLKRHRPEFCDGRCKTCESLGIPCVRGRPNRGSKKPCETCEKNGHSESCSFYKSEGHRCPKCFTPFDGRPNWNTITSKHAKEDARGVNLRIFLVIKYTPVGLEDLVEAAKISKANRLVAHCATRSTHAQSVSLISERRHCLMSTTLRLSSGGAHRVSSEIPCLKRSLHNRKYFSCIPCADSSQAKSCSLWKL